MWETYLLPILGQLQIPSCSPSPRTRQLVETETWWRDKLLSKERWRTGRTRIVEQACMEFLCRTGTIAPPAKVSMDPVLLFSGAVTRVVVNFLSKCVMQGSVLPQNIMMLELAWGIVLAFFLRFPPLLLLLPLPESCNLFQFIHSHHLQSFINFDTMHYIGSNWVTTKYCY